MRMTPRRHQQPAKPRPGWWRQRIPLMTVLLILVAGTWAFVTIADNQQRASAARSLVEQREFAKRIDAQVKATLQKRIDDARKAEAEARANAYAEAAARAALTSPSVPLARTTNPTNCAINNPDSLQAIINKKRCFSPLDYAPTDLVDTGDVTMRQEAADHYSAMAAAATAAGQGFSASSSFRSYATQVTTYNYWVGVSGSVQADTYSARPGYSEHQTGLAVDVKVGSCALSCFNGSSQYVWLRENAATFGFIQRYPEGLTSITGYTAEPWHWRYVGMAVASDMKAKGIETLEQYYRVEGGDYRQ